MSGFPAIVTRFYLLTRPAQQMYQSLYVYPISEYKKVLEWVIDVSLDALCPQQPQSESSTS